MCGIFSIINGKTSHGETWSGHDILGDYNLDFSKGKPRGPEQSSFKEINENLIFGFHRLAINGLDDDSMQPITIKHCTLICNGEIYNHKELYSIGGFTAVTGSDCEIILHMYLEHGIEYTLQTIDGVFAFALYDETVGKVFIARDTYGVRPLFIGRVMDFLPPPSPATTRSLIPPVLGPDNRGPIAIASELKSIANIKFTNNIKPPFPLFTNIEQFAPGTYSVVDLKEISSTHNIKFSHGPNAAVNYSIDTEEKACQLVRDSLIAAVDKRVDNTDRPVACLLSGGLDSSLISALVNRHFKPGKLHTWSIGLDGSEDVSFARKVSRFLTTTHHEFTVGEQEMLDSIDEVIRVIETYDTTTVRASVCNWLIAKKIKENSDAKVIFNGDGSDELCGGYMYFHHAPDDLEFDRECKRLLSNIHYFDVLRSDRTISSHGLEPRTPFLDRSFVQNYLSIPHHLRNHNNGKKCEKYLLRKSFESMNLLPTEILFRTKEAFSDGVSKVSRSWFEIIQTYISTHKMTPLFNKTFANLRLDHCPPITDEQKYYRAVFHKHYGHNAQIMPYFWMPRFIEASDASARTLKVYSENRNKTKNSNSNKQADTDTNTNTSTNINRKIITI